MQTINIYLLTLLTYLLTPWSRVLEKLTGFEVSQEIPRILWNPKVHYHIHKCPPPVPTLCVYNWCLQSLYFHNKLTHKSATSNMNFTKLVDPIGIKMPLCLIIFCSKNLEKIQLSCMTQLNYGPVSARRVTGYSKS